MKFDAVLFDCDGVLVDSEPITNGVLRDMLEEIGWKLTPEECMRTFIGKAVKDEAAIIEAKTGRPLSNEWLAEFRERRNVRLNAEVVPIRGADHMSLLLVPAALTISPPFVPSPPLARSRPAA